MQLRLILVGAFLCGCYSDNVAASISEPKHDTQKLGSTSDDSLEPIILEADFSKEGHFVKSCYGAHFKPVEEAITFYWALPAECLDKTKYDRVLVKFAHHGFGAELALEDLDFEIHPGYNATTKADNIAIARLPFYLYREAKSGYKYVQLPSASDNFETKMLELYENRYRATGNATDVRNVSYTAKTKVFNSLWCEILHPLSIKANHICVSGHFGEGSSKDQLGAPLIARDGDSFKFVGFATSIRSHSWTKTSLVPKEVEILKIQPYLDWIKQDSKFKAYFTY